LPSASRQRSRIGDDPHTPQLATIERVIRRLNVLLVLDNCEYLVDTCASICDQLVRASEVVRILATSREPLAVPGDIVFRVRPLSTPAIAAKDATAATADSEAVQLFVQRASAVHPGFQSDASNAEAVAHVCRRVDGSRLPSSLQRRDWWRSAHATWPRGSTTDFGCWQATCGRSATPPDARRDDRLELQPLDLR
jgi:hypothetical protein